MGKNSVDSEGAFGRVPHDIEVQQRPRRPIQGSVARASFALHGSVAIFGRAIHRTLDKIIQDKVIVRKRDRGVPGSKIFVTNRSAATQALPIKFLGSFHLQSKNAAGENNQKAKHIQEEFVCNLDVVKKFLERVVQYDMKMPLQVPAVYHDIVGEDAWEDRWDMTNPNREIIDLTAHWGKVTLDHCCKWQRDFNGYCDDADHVSSIWIKELVMNSLDPELKKQVYEKYSKLEAYQQGGITFFKITMDTVFKMSIMAEESLKSFIKDFGKNGLAKIPSENVRLISGQIDGVAERLADSGLLRSKTLIHYINGYMICTVDAFKQVFSNKAVEYTYLHATGESSFSSMTSGDVLKAMHEISTAARAIFDHLHLGNKWNLPGKHGHHAAATVNKCENCGSLDHLAPKCPKPRNDEKCKKAREARAKAKGTEGGRGQGRGGRGGGAGRRDSNGQRAPWSDTAKGANSGVANVDGTWKIHCSKCGGWNETHTTKYHEEQQRSAATFKVPPHHPFWLMSGKIYPAVAAAGVTFAPTGAGAASTGSTMSGSVLASLPGVIDRALTTTESSEMSSFLADFRNVLGN